MRTLKEAHSHFACYWGDRPDWLVVLARTRDSGALERSNFECAETLLRAEAADDVAVERSSHWAVGWVDYIVINPANQKLVEFAQENIIDAMESYPVLDESHFSNEETEEANQVWADCYRPKERIEYIRAHRHQFEFRSFVDLLGCVRGKYFAGYACELLA